MRKSELPRETEISCLKGLIHQNYLHIKQLLFLTSCEQQGKDISYRIFQEKVAKNILTDSRDAIYGRPDREQKICDISLLFREDKHLDTIYNQMICFFYLAFAQQQWCFYIYIPQSTEKMHSDFGRILVSSSNWLPLHIVVKQWYTLCFLETGYMP